LSQKSGAQKFSRQKTCVVADLGVTDTGTGMDEVTLRRAMEPFFTTKGAGKGTGLGLSMVHGLAEQSGGRFILQSHFGQGTTAELWLPVSQTPAGQIEESSALPEETNGQRHALVVVAVDDDALVLLNTVAMLEDLGHTVFAAYSGKEALDILRREGKDVDLVITDQAMPQMTGTQLADAVNREWPEIPLILATGYAETPPGAGAKLPKLSKPFTQAELREELSRVRPRSHKNGRVLKFRAGAERP